MSDKLAKICGMLASPNDQERATAAKLATEMLKKHGLTWDDVIRQAVKQTKTPEPDMSVLNPDPWVNAAASETANYWSQRMREEVRRQHDLEQLWRQQQQQAAQNLYQDAFGLSGLFRKRS